MNQALPAHVADLLRLERAQRILAGQEPGNVVEPASGVHRYPLVPPSPVEPQPVVRRGRGDLHVSGRYYPAIDGAIE